jgi:hypothetical protein
MKSPGGIETTSTGALLVCDQEVACGEFEPGSTMMTNLFAGQLQRYHYPGPDGRAKETMTVPGGGYSGVAVSPASPQGAPY